MSRVVVGQVLPDAEAETLRGLRVAASACKHRSPEREHARRRLCGYIILLRHAGWTDPAMARALNVSNQAVERIADKYEPILTGLPGVAMPPEREEQARESSWAPPLPDSIRDQLAQLRRASEGLRGQVRGTAREQSPEGRASAEFATIVNHLITEQGYTEYRIACDLGLTPLAITRRLARWGYRPFPPSQVPVYLREREAAS